MLVAAAAGIAGLSVAALRRAAPVPPTTVMPPLLLAAGGALWSVALFGVLLMASGTAPQVPPAIPLAAAAAIAATPLALRRARPATRDARVMLVAGVVDGSMAVSFIAFIGATLATGVHADRRCHRAAYARRHDPPRAPRRRYSPTLTVTRMSRPASGAKSFRKLAWRRASASKMLLADSSSDVRLPPPNGLNPSEALTSV